MPARRPVFVVAAALVGATLTVGGGATPSASTPAVTTAPTAHPATTASLAAAGLDPAIARSLSTGAQSRYLGPYLSGRVVDRATGRAVWSHNATRVRMPASTQKVLTALTVLRSTPAASRLGTRSLQSRANPGNVYLRGGGDPTLTTTRLAALAATTSAKLKSQGRNRVNLYLDDTVFPRPTMATGWKSSYISGQEVQHVRGLTLARYRGADGTVAAGNAFRAQLKKRGITVATFGRAAAPAARTELSATWSTTVGAIVAHTLSVSDNDYAEYLLRIAALEAGLYPTWTNSLAHQRATLARAGVSTTAYRAYDGSGLSRANRVPTATLTSAISALYARPADRAVVFAWGAMPRSGQTGTLRARYRSGAARCATGRVIAKTGTLGDVVALAGIARGVDGRDRVFAFLENGRRETAATRAAVDALAARAVGCVR